LNSTTLILIVCILIFIVVPSFKDRTVPVKKLLLGPVAFSYLFYQSLKEFQIVPLSYIFIAAGILLGIFLGYRLRKSTPLRVDAEHKSIAMQGSFFTLYIFLVIFSVHFVAGYLKAVQPVFFSGATFVSNFLLMLLAITSCLPIGSNGCLFLRYLSGKNAVSNKIYDIRSK
jgi:hypothetical protein